MYKFLQPLQGSQLLQQHPSDSPLVVDASWTHMLQLAQASSPLLRRALEVRQACCNSLSCMTPACGLWPSTHDGLRGNQKERMHKMLGTASPQGTCCRRIEANWVHALL